MNPPMNFPIEETKYLASNIVTWSTDVLVSRDILLSGKVGYSRKRDLSSDKLDLQSSLENYEKNNIEHLMVHNFNFSRLHKEREGLKIHNVGF